MFLLNANAPFSFDGMVKTACVLVYSKIYQFTEPIRLKVANQLMSTLQHSVSALQAVVLSVKSFFEAKRLGLYTGMKFRYLEMSYDRLHL
jgi:hypothetical protein